MLHATLAYLSNSMQTETPLLLVPERFVEHSFQKLDFDCFGNPRNARLLTVCQLSVFIFYFL